jgi:hypothetical protein
MTTLTGSIKDMYDEGLSGLRDALREGRDFGLIPDIERESAVNCGGGIALRDSEGKRIGTFFPAPLPSPGFICV